MQAERLQTDTTMLVSEPRAVYEIQLQAAWNSIDSGCELLTANKQTLKVWSPGIWNWEAGPDFSNAKLEINGEILSGDVEVHYLPSDWKSHRHHENQAYDNVVLHVVGKAGEVPVEVPDLPLLVILPEKEINSQRQLKYGKCAPWLAAAGDAKLKDFFEAAGLERFRIKSEKILESMLKKGVNETLFRFLFDAMGYKKNRENFLQLFERYLEYPKEDREKHLLAILWGESGLLPDLAIDGLTDEMRTFIKDCWTVFWKLRKQAPMEIDWQRSGSRPLNSPERRLAGLCALIGMGECCSLEFFAKIFSENSPREAVRKIMKSIQLEDELWSRYSTFFAKCTKKSVLIGSNRSLELMVNVILPCLYAYARISRDNVLLEQIEEGWRDMSRTQENRLSKNAVMKFFVNKDQASKIIKNVAGTQGLIHIYREFCEKAQGDCDACLLYNSLYFKD
jgi:hypothetical protein